MIECPDCDGMGGYDKSSDCEMYDDWQECPTCNGTGETEEGDTFVPERDALTFND